jgi:parvulin-like peptidyl-prolyl isomerase
VTRLRSLPTAIVALVLAALVLSACGESTSDAAATVNGRTISNSEFREELDLLTEHPQFAQVAFGAVATPSASPSVVDQEFAGAVLRLKIYVSLVEAEFERRGLEVTDADLARAAETFAPGMDELLAAMPDDYAADFRLWNAQLIVLRDQLEAEATERPDEVSDEEVRLFFDDYQVLFVEEEVCARHILVDTEGEADDVLAELEGGADFGELAAERSVDPSAEFNEGDLGCTGRGRYVPEFETAAWEGPVGEIQGPVQTDFGYHVILVDSRGTPGFEAVEADIRAFLESPASRQGQQLLNLLVQQMAATAEVTVDQRYGQWDAETQSVVPLATSQVGGTGS